MNKKIIFLLSILIMLISVSLFFFYSEKKETKTEKETEVKEEQPLLKAIFKSAFAQEKLLIQPKDIVLNPVKITPQVPPYSLPLELSQIDNFKRVSQYIKFPQTVLDGLLNKGFVVFPPAILSANQNYKFEAERFDRFYSYLKEISGACKDEWNCTEEEIKLGLPIPYFITADTVLHYYHLIFDSSLMRMEREIFFDSLWQFDKTMLLKSIEDYKNAQDETIREAARRNMAYFSVALKLLQPTEEQVLTAAKLKDKEGYESVYWSIKNSCGLTNASCIRKYIEKNLPNEFSKNALEKYQFEVPQEVKKEVEEELNLINKHERFTYSPIFIYKEDYSQYVPRGHYSQGEKLKNYFKAMMWHGRITMLAKGSEELMKGESNCLKTGIISVEDAQIQTAQAALISKHFEEDEGLQKTWKKIYNITSFYVGYSDDLGPYEYLSLIDKILSGEKITKEDISQLQNNILNSLPNPKIYSGLGDCELKNTEIKSRIEEAEQYLKNTKGFRLMGQRYVLDSYLMSKLVSPYSGYYNGDKNNLPFTAVTTEVGTIVRGFPRGLDIMALLGSERAKYWLQKLGDNNYTDYNKAFNSLNTEVSSLSNEDWFKNLYFAWLYTLQPLFEKFGSGYPTFMQQEEYSDKLLNTALASWTELRHDTILYVKQSYTMSEGGFGPYRLPSRSYLEPLPELYNRLLTLVQMTKNGLKSLLSEEEWQTVFPNSIYADANRKSNVLDYFSSVLEKLLDISKKELENKALTQEEYDFLDDFNETSENLIEGLVSNQKGGDVVEGMDNILKTTLVADVHTDGNTKMALEEGVGKLKVMMVAYKLPDGRINVGIGPVFSYYEFKQPINQRLTDEAWRILLDNNPPPEPEWIQTYSVK